MQRSMNHPSRPFILFVLLLGMSCAIGCSPDTADVEGTVSFNGLAVENGMVTFTPMGEYGTVVGSKIEKGKFKASGIFPGETLVQVVATRSVTFPQDSADMATSAPPMGTYGPDTAFKGSADLIPRNAEGNNSTYTLAAGANKLELELFSPRLPSDSH